jgi:hypothetical protein
MRSSNVPISSTEQVLATIPSDAILREACFSPDGTSVAYIVSRGDSYLVTCANGTESNYDHAEHLVVGPRGKVTAYQASVKGKRFISTNSKHEREYFWVSDPVQDWNGTSIAYWAMDQAGNQDTYYLIMDNLVLGSYSAPGRIVRFASSHDLTYTARQESHAFLFSHGFEGPRFEEVYCPVIDPHSNTLWYWGRTEKGWSLIRDHEEYDRTEEVALCPGPIFSDDGKYFAYWRKVGAQWQIARNDETLPGVSELAELVSTPVLSSRGSVAYVGKEGSKVFVSLDDERGQEFDAVGTPSFSPDGASMAFKARLNAKEFVVIDGCLSEEFDVIWPEEREMSDYLEDIPVFSDDGKAVAYRARRGDKESIVLNNDVSEPFDFLTGFPRFRPGSRSLVYGAMIDKQEYVVVDGKRSDPFEQVWSVAPTTGISTLCWSPVFNDRGDRVVFGAWVDDKLVWKVL